MNYLLTVLIVIIVGAIIVAIYFLNVQFKPSLQCCPFGVPSCPIGSNGKVLPTCPTTTSTSEITTTLSQVPLFNNTPNSGENPPLPPS